MKFLIFLSMFGCVSDYETCVAICYNQGKQLDYLVVEGDNLKCKCERN